MKTVKLATFIENPDNPQTVTAEDFALLVESLRTMPQTLAASKIAYVTDYTAVDGADLRGQRVVIAGNKRLRALKQLAADHATSADGAIKFDGPLPAEWFYDLTPLGPDARRAWLVKSNVQSGEWDAEKLLALYDRDELGDLMGDKALEEILKAVDKDEPKDGKTDADAVPDAPETPVSKRGEVYQCGEHRLMCGDSTKVEEIAEFVRGGVDMVLTDPPYNVAYVGGTKDALTIENDRQEDGEFQDFLACAFEAADNVLKPGGSIYVWLADSEQYNFTAAWRRVGWKLRQVLVWVKNSLVLGRQDYQWQHEPCLYGWKDGAAHYFCNDRTQTTVIEDKPDIKKMKVADLRKMVTELLDVREVPTTVIHENKPARNAEHPTMKPVKLIARLIRNSSKRGETILDSFGGSGTTMIAAEQLGRICLTVELDPHYCDVIRKRWAEFVHGEGCDWKALTPCAANVPRQQNNSAHTSSDRLRGSLRSGDTPASLRLCVKNKTTTK